MKAHVPVLGHHHTHLSRADYVTGRRRTSDVENFEMATIIAFIQPAEYAVFNRGQQKYICFYRMVLGINRHILSRVKLVSVRERESSSFFLFSL